MSTSGAEALSGGHSSSGGLVYTVLHARIPGLIQTIQALCILNIPLCVIIIATVLGHIRRYDLRTHVSFRLSISIAIADLMYSIIQLIVNNESYTDTLSEMGIRTLFFFHLLCYNALIFTTACVAFHLHMTALANRRKLARKISPYYELIAWVVSAIVGHPIFYIYKRFSKIHGMNVIMTADTSMGHIRALVWLMYGWCAIALLYCAFVCVLVVIRLLPKWRDSGRSSYVLTFPEEANTAGSGSIGNNYTYRVEASSKNLVGKSSKSNATSAADGVDVEAGQLSERQDEFHTKKEIRFAIIRIALYLVAPLISTPVLPAYLSMEHPSVNIVNVVIILPCLGGLLNFAIFMIHPLLDPFWKAIGRFFVSLFKRFKKKDSTKVRDGHYNSRNDVRSGGAGVNNDGADIVKELTTPATCPYKA
ncbi:hypothetical protein H4219_002421 [Mycoemilia scoparia]|uniref:G-protein coupled receptors family 1 profile domain-containing protein n=1 Tax=Mycoemilia scoparia TaxID=417184 RepID=A0A9W8A6X4_9FUNG|nr:hypothetical protein H4219_002421 [Mycoemilia scoparia]